jgi:hypothetical protein
MSVVDNVVVGAERRGHRGSLSGECQALAGLEF